MSETIVSSKYQVVIPKAARQQIALRPGQRLSVIVKGGIIHLVPVLPLEQSRGIAAGISIEGLREKVDRV